MQQQEIANLRAMSHSNIVAGETEEGLKRRLIVLEGPWGYENYGKCNANDYPNFYKLVASLICYTNKQYYAYKAIEDNTKVGYLSRKQYVKYAFLLTRDPAAAKEFLRTSGRMTTMYKLLKRAIDENPRAHWLKTQKLEEYALEELSRVLQKDACIEFQEVPVQEAYALQLQDNRIGSGQRFCTHSCMYNDPVGSFYSSFNCKAYIAKKQNEKVGRFLVWETEDGKTYVDRLYCNGGTQDDILKAIDEHWKTALKYPCLQNSRAPRLVVKLKTNDLSHFTEDLFYPYVDSFSVLSRVGDELVLSNRLLGNGEEMVLHDASGHSMEKFVRCPKCGKLYVKSKYSHGRITSHYMECEREYGSDKEKEIYLQLFYAFQ